ncbi:HdeD family acid-resistance protein, partial [Georgenia ruanii]|nr:HdeD family acid-resistance protein [Georgenia ruanii]
VRGAVAIIFAIVILLWPGIALATLIALVGAYALVSGIAMIVGAFSVPIRGGQRAWIIFEGLLGIAVGVVVFVWPNLSALGLLYAIAAWAILVGILEIVLAFVLPFTGGRTLLLALGGVLWAAFGVIMFARPGAGAVALLALIAAFAFVTGVMHIGLALDLRRLDMNLNPVAPPGARPTA